MAAAETVNEVENNNAPDRSSPLDLEQLAEIIRENNLPAEILDSGRTWVCVQLTDD